MSQRTKPSLAADAGFLQSALEGWLARRQTKDLWGLIEDSNIHVQFQFRSSRTGVRQLCIITQSEFH
jgi:hypothetical protein